MEKKHLLIVSKGLLYSLNNVNQGKNTVLSSWATGDFTHLVEDKRLVDSTCSSRDDGFRLIACYLPAFIVDNFPFLVTAYFYFSMFFRLVFRHYFVKNYACIIARDPIFSGILGFSVAKLCGIPLVVEFNGNYSNNVNWSGHKKSFFGYLKYKIVQRVIPFICNKAVKIKLLYPSQADHYIFEKDKLSVFHEYTPISNLEEIANNEVERFGEPYVVFLGNPWRTKGVDILIKAFNRISIKHDDICLDVVGWFPGGAKRELLSLIESDRIRVRDAVDYPEALGLIKHSKLLVLPSRTEAMGRVLLESMALKVPVVGSRVDGIPNYIDEDVTGLLFDSEDVEGLYQKLDLLLSSPELCEKLSQDGFEKVMNDYSELAYSKSYKKLIGDACEN